MKIKEDLIILWERIAQISGCVLILFAGFVQLLKMGIHHSRQWSSKRQILKKLQHNDDKQSVHLVMVKCAKVHGWSYNFSIQQWLDDWEHRYGENLSLRLALERYEEKCFSGNKHNL